MRLGYALLKMAKMTRLEQMELQRQMERDRMRQQFLKETYGDEGFLSSVGSTMYDTLFPQSWLGYGGSLGGTAMGAYFMPGIGIPLLAAHLIASPIAYWAENKWMQAREQEKRNAQPIIENPNEADLVGARQKWNRYLTGQVNRGSFFRPVVRGPIQYRPTGPARPAGPTRTGIRI